MKKNIYLYLLLSLNLEANKIKEGFVEIEVSESKFYKNVVNGEQKIASKVKSVAKNLEGKIEDEFYELGEFKVNGLQYVPLHNKTIQFYLKEHDKDSIYLKDEKLLDTHLNKIYKMLEYIPLPDFNTAVRNEEEESFIFIEKFGSGYHNTLKYTSRVFGGTLFLLTLYNDYKLLDKNKENKNTLNYSMTIINIIILATLIAIFPSKEFYLNMSITALFYFLHIILLLTNGYFTYINVKDSKETSYMSYGAIFGNILFIISNILYTNFYPYEYNKIKRKIDRLIIIKKDTPISMLTENPYDNYAIPAKDIKYLADV